MKTAPNTVRPPVKRRSPVARRSDRKPLKWHKCNPNGTNFEDIFQSSRGRS